MERHMANAEIVGVKQPLLDAAASTAKMPLIESVSSE